jgi:hypothetical protein
VRLVAGPARLHITPLEVMEMDHALAECVITSGKRRSARMVSIEQFDLQLHSVVGH